MDGGAQGEYFEAQDAAWCGMHALNNLLGGPYVTKDACGLAARRVANELSQVGGADQETISLHLHPGTGWLSIDVINVLGATTSWSRPPGCQPRQATNVLLSFFHIFCRLQVYLLACLLAKIVSQLISFEVLFRPSVYHAIQRSS